MKINNQNKLFFELCLNHVSEKQKEAILLILETDVNIDNLISVLNDTN